MYKRFKFQELTKEEKELESRLIISAYKDWGRHYSFDDFEKAYNNKDEKLLDEMMTSTLKNLPGAKLERSQFPEVFSSYTKKLNKIRNAIYGTSEFPSNEEVIVRFNSREK